MSAVDPLPPLLDGLRVPAMPPSLADRIVAEAIRPGRTPSLAITPPPRRRMRRWTRRGVWTTLVAVNLIVASAVAAAIGGGVLDPHRIVAAAHRIVDHIRHPHAEPAPAHHRHVAAPGPPTVATVRPVGVTRAIAPIAATSRGFAMPPGHLAVPPNSTPRLTAVAPMRRLPPMLHPRSRPFHQHNAARIARFAEPRDHLGGREGRTVAVQRATPVQAPAVRADAPAARTEPLRADTSPAAFGPRWRQRGWRGWRGWQNRQNVATALSGERQPADATDRQERRGDAIGPRQQSRRGNGFRPGRRFGGGGPVPHGGRGGGRRRF